MKNKILLLMLVVASVMGRVRAQNAESPIGAARDSVVYSATFYFQSGAGNWIQPSDYMKTGLLLRWAESNITTPIVITGWADKTGTTVQNDKISLARARSIRNYLVKKGIASERISFEGRGVDKLAISNEKGRRADVCGVIRLIDEPQSIQSQSKVEEAAQPTEDKTPIAKETEQPLVEQESRVVVEDVINFCKPLFAIKTNLLYDAIITPNLELEILIGKRWSINAEYQLAWWDKSDNSFCWHIHAGGLEGRYWFGDREECKLLNGWFVGAFVHGGTYDFQLKKNNGYQGDFIIPGISGGYATSIARNLNLEFSLGVGYMMSNYHHYDVISRELVDYGETKQFRNIFPAKAKVSLVWMINRNVKKGSKL